VQTPTPSSPQKRKPKKEEETNNGFVNPGFVAQQACSGKIDLLTADMT